ncbi:MAG: hypothetical protein IIZ47_04925, partial [Erysipelotrichaceae bacterium]|nr:hypothetical protein [Erysipelotrichaceae bacterium]
MKKTKIFTLIAIVCLLVACFGCSGKDQGDEPVQPEEITADVTMENFVKKLEAGNYVIDAKDYVKTVAVSPEKVYFVHKDVESGLNRAFVTKDGETFEIRLTENGTDDVAFVSKDNAINVLTYLLPNYWINYTGNMFDLFYNNVDDPLEFTSHDETVKTTLLGLGGYGQMALSQMEDVHMVLDAADPSSVHFTAVIHDVPAARIYYDDLDLTLQFGAGETDPRIEEWIKNPTYPETRTCWSIYDIGTLESVFYKDYGELAVPFPSFASYAMNFDRDAYMERTEVLLTDAHGTEEDVENYIKVLTDRGYKKATKTLEDGSTKTVYRLLLREAYHAYAELEPVYNDGFELTGRMYYDNAVYDGQQAISDAVVKHGFEPLEETDLFTGWTATDTFAPRSEGWIYFFDYDMYLAFPLEYKDFEAAKAYLNDYGNKLLEKGFVPVYTPNEDDGQFETPN